MPREYEKAAQTALAGLAGIKPLREPEVQQDELHAQLAKVTAVMSSATAELGEVTAAEVRGLEEIVQQVLPDYVT